MFKIFNYEPDIKKEDIEKVVNCLELGIANPIHISNLETSLEERFKINSTTCSSGTAALHLSLVALGVGPGDEVICPNYTFAATWNVIAYVGATPVFADICDTTWCIDPDSIERKITNKTKAILTVDLFGNPCDYEKIKKICEKNRIYLIQDCAESLGSNFQNKSVLRAGDVSCTSFNLNKVITSAGGGLVASENDSLLRIIKNLKNQNKKQNEYDYHGMGFNYRMSSINAALLDSQLNRFEEILNRKSKIDKIYRDRLTSDVISFQEITSDSSSNNWVTVIELKTPAIRNHIQNYLIKNGVEVKRTFKPATSIGWIQDRYELTLGNIASRVYERSLILPSSPKLSDFDVGFICDMTEKVLRGKYL